jgi:hypothetical protein
MPALDVPDWVPVAVVKVSSQLLARSDLRSAMELIGVDGEPSVRLRDILLPINEKALIRRLLIDDRMRGVWERLQRAPCNDLDVCLAMVFSDAFFSIKILNIEHAVGKIAALEGDKKLIARLRADAALLHERWDAIAIEDDAADLEKEIDLKLRMERMKLPVHRNYGRNHKRKYAVFFAREVRKYFKLSGNALWDIVATVTNVAFGGQVEKHQDVAKHNVRDWLKDRALKS